MSNTSEQLLARFAHDLDSSREIYDRYSAKILRIANQKLPTKIRSKVDTDDILQETIEAAFMAVERGAVIWKTNGDLWKYIYGILCNKIASVSEKFRSGKRNLKTEERLPDNLGGRNSIPNSTISFWELVESEKPLVQSVIRMCVQGYSQQEIAETISRSTRTVRRILESFRIKLVQQELAPRNWQPSDSLLDKHVVCYKDFTLLRMLGAGNFAKVYLACNNESQHLYAFKAVRKQWLQNDTVRAAFINEFEKLQQIHNPFVVKTFGWGNLPNNGLFLLLEYVDGMALSQCINSATICRRRRWGQQIEQTVHSLHQHGIAHRDLSLRNILITGNDSVKLIDFAFSKNIGDFDSAKNEDLTMLNRLRQQMQF